MNSRENSSNYRPLLYITTCWKRKDGRNYPKKYEYLTSSCASKFTNTNILDTKWRIQCTRTHWWWLQHKHGLYQSFFQMVEFSMWILHLPLNKLHSLYEKIAREIVFRLFDLISLSFSISIKGKILLMTTPSHYNSNSPFILCIK